MVIDNTVQSSGQAQVSGSTKKVPRVLKRRRAQPLLIFCSFIFVPVLAIIFLWWYNWSDEEYMVPLIKAAKGPYKVRPEVPGGMKILNKEPKDHKNFLRAYELFANHYDDFEAIKKIDRKTLVMTGSDDVGSTPAMSKELVKDLVNSTYIEIQNGKHLCSIECADDVNMNIRNFINN